MEKSVTESGNVVDNEALKRWSKDLLDTTVREMVRVKVIDGARVEAKPVWADPYKILIAQIRQAGKKRQFIWTISGEGVITDHMAGSMAASPRDAARRFSLKWQMDADRLSKLAQARTSDAKTRANVESVANRMILQAESLYDLVNQDDRW